MDNLSLFNKLRLNQLEARKAGDRTTAATLGVVIAESSKNDKTPSDEVVTATIRKFIKGLEEVLIHAPDTEAAKVEKALLETYVPTMLDEPALRLVVLTSNLPIEMKGMKALKEYAEMHYPGRVDGKLLADIVKKMVTS